MSKRGRPPLPPERRRHKRVVIRADRALEADARLYAEYQGKTLQELTCEWWAWITKKHPDFRVPQKSQAVSLEASLTT